MKIKLSEVTSLPVFPYAEEFPLISEDESMELAQDLEQNGQQFPIIIFVDETATVEDPLQEPKHWVLDGRNRLRAFQKTNLNEVDVEYFHGTVFQAVEKIRALNILRRHLNVGQRAMAAQAYLPYEEAEAKLRQQLAGGVKERSVEPDPAQAETEPKKRAPQSRDIVAEKFNLSGQRISEAKKLLLCAPDLAEKVKTDELSLDKATKELKARNEAHEKKIQELESKAPDLYLKVQRNELTLDEGYVNLINRIAERKRDQQVKSEALYSLQTLTENTEQHLREFNLKIGKFSEVDHIDQALAHIETLEKNLFSTKSALIRAREQVEESEE